MLYANVCVNTPLGQRPGPAAEAEARTFTYAVPDRLAGQLQPGHLVWVTFRGRRLQAVVLDLSDAAPTFDTHEVLSLVWAQPVLTPSQIRLAQWISSYYLAPLIEALRLMLPVGLSQRGRTVLARTAKPVPGNLTSTQAAVLARVEQAAGEWAEITTGLRGVTQAADLEPLIAAGLVTREVAFATPAPRPKTDRQVRLLAGAETVARLLPTLGRASKQADVLAHLARQPAPIPLDELCAVVGCGRGPVDALAQRGWVTITRAAAKASPLVSLTLAEDAVLDALVELRGAEKHRAVLEALQRAGGAAWIGWVYAETDATLAILRDLEAVGLATIAEEMVWRDPLADYEFTLDQPPTLTADQERVWEAIRGQEGWEAAAREQRSRGAEERRSGGAAVREQGSGGAEERRSGGAAAILIHGVTGSGKTEIYLRAIAETLKRGRQAVALVPEIALTPQTIRRFAARFPGKVTIWHSELGEGERFDVWRRVRTNHAASQVVVGSRSALFLPFPDLGLIVLDEEHEPSYKQERTPRYHARTAALELGRLCAAPVILGSATPALETYYAAQRGEIALLGLPKRVLGHGSDEGRKTNDEQGRLPSVVSDQADDQPPTDDRRPMATAHGHPPSVVGGQAAELPPVQVVDMRQELRAGNRGVFSRVLAAEMGRALAASQQVMLYLNRRGASTFIMCRDCGHVEACPRCAVPLTFHRAGELLLCHHCNRRYPAPALCRECQSKRIRHFGAGTEAIEEAVKLAFPAARTLRWDRDVTGAKGSHDTILSRFVAHEADVLIGTQMIAKGLDLPLVTLVGVVAADTGLFLPDFRAGERTFQLLTQVAGRAGRSALGGRVILQTYHPDHYAIVAASRHDYEGFYRQEMAFRRQQGYPPVRRLARLIYLHSQRAKAQAEATRLAEQLTAEIGRRALVETDLIGPAPCFFSQERGEYRWQVVVRSSDPAALLRHVPLPLGWRLDMDPVDLL